MSKKKKYISLIILLIGFSVYCGLTIGQSLDEEYHLAQGKITFDYLFSLGKINKDIPYGEFYSTIYWSLLYIITELFPRKYLTEISHLVSLFFSFAVIFGIGKVSSELFNKKVGKIIFILLFFYPIFFGHMSINNKDTILALSHVWMVYLILRYLKKQDIKNKTKKYVLSLAVLGAVSTGIQLTFLGSQIPILLFLLIEIFLVKKIINKNFSKKYFYFDLLKCFMIFYFLLILFWKDAHENILTYPFLIIQNWLSSDLITGWPYNLINGNYYLSVEVPSLYFIINFLYKSPEYILLCYLIFFLLIIQIINFYKERIVSFNYKLSLIILILIFPNLIMLLIPFPVNDGMRLFLWTVPYYLIIPSLLIYFLIENLNLKKFKVIFSVLMLFFIYHLFNFFSITPYQYTYLNLLNGKVEERYKKFENDYWATSIKELIKNANFETNKAIKISTCGFISSTPKKYFKKRLDLNYRFVSPDKADYIIMTNRVSRHHGIKNCFDIFKGNDIALVKRNGLILSVIRKIKL